jgi:hypothetical protein
MLWDQGASFFDFKGIVWNGANKAAIGYDHYEDKTHRGEFVTGAVHRLCAYINFKVAGFRVHDLFWPIENRKSRAVHVFTRYRYIYRQKYTNT